jgi:CRP/FNR family transcriptional regulator
MFRQEFAKLSIFNGLDPAQTTVLSPFLKEVSFSKGQVIFQQDESADSLYILLNGEVLVRYKPYDGPPLTVAKIAPGDVFGWSAALGHDVYTSGAEAAAPSCAYCIRAEDLQHLCDVNPEAGGKLLEGLAGVIAERLRNTHGSILELLNQGVDRKNGGVKRSEMHER